MSHNIKLYDKNSTFSLYQTPTYITDKLLNLGSTKDIVEGYFTWLDDLPTVDSFNMIDNLLEEVDYLNHKVALLTWLIEHPHHKWTST